MKPKVLYRIFITGIFTVILVMGILYRIERARAPKETSAETAPAQSGFTEVEFESGAELQKLTEQQQARLHAYRGHPKTDQTVEVPIERATEEYLDETVNAHGVRGNP